MALQNHNRIFVSAENFDCGIHTATSTVSIAELMDYRPPYIFDQFG